MPRCLKTDGSARAQGESRRRHHDGTWGGEQRGCVQKTVFDSLTGEAFIARYDELTKLSAQLAANLKISSSLQSKRRNTICNGVAAGGIEEQAVSNFSGAVQDNTHSMQLASTSQVPSSHRLKTKNKKHSTVEKIKNSVKENRKDDRTTIVSANNKCRTNNLVTNQVGCKSFF